MSSSAHLGSKATRTSAPKSRNGCIICKAKHTKCDETRPSCRLCIKSGIQCQYGSSKQIAKKSRVIRPQHNPSLSQARPSGTMKFVDQREIYYFWAYQDDTAQELSGLLNSSAWNRTMLQTCHTEPFVLRSVVAIGAINKSLKMSYDASLGPPKLQNATRAISRQHREFAISAYVRAFSGMRQVELDPESPSALRKALISSVLVHCLEVFLGSPTAGYVQSHAAYNLLRRWMQKNNLRDKGICSPDSSIIEDELFHEISRLDHQSALFGVLTPSLERHSKGRLEAAETVRNMPAIFSGLAEAQAFSALVIRRTTHLLGEVKVRVAQIKIDLRHPKTADSSGELVDPCYLPVSLLDERDKYLEDIRCWWQAFKPISALLLSSPDPKTAASASLLMIEALHAEVSLAGGFFTNESSYDVFLPHFRGIVEFSKIVLERSQELYDQDVPRFQLASGTAWCLYEMIFICRDAKIRKEALSMLREQAERDAGKFMNYRSRLVLYAMWVVGLEEQGRRNDGSLPESARYQKMAIMFSPEDETHSMTFVASQRLGYPLGVAYPASRVWKRRTVSEMETFKMTLGDTIDPMPQPWPSFLPKPNVFKWQEVHQELLETTRKTLLALSENP